MTSYGYYGGGPAYYGGGPAYYGGPGYYGGDGYYRLGVPLLPRPSARRLVIG